MGENCYFSLFHAWRFRFPLPGKRRGSASGAGELLFFSLPCVAVSISPIGETKGSVSGAGELLFFSLPCEVVSISPIGETKGSGIRIEVRAPFSCKRGPLGKHPAGIFSNSLSENAPYGWSIPPIAMGGQGSSPWISAECLRRRFAFMASANNSLIPRVGSPVLHLVRFATAWVAH